MITCTFEKGYKANLRHVVVHAIIVQDGRMLLEKRTGNILETGKWALPGGFVNRDETAGQAVIREVKEETGYDGKVTALFRINTRPDRPHEDRQNIALEFIVDPVTQTGISDKEVSGIAWFPLDKLPSLDALAFDHGQTVALFLKFRRKKFPLPLVV